MKWICALERAEDKEYPESTHYCELLILIANYNRLHRLNIRFPVPENRESIRDLIFDLWSLIFDSWSEGSIEWWYLPMGDPRDYSFKWRIHELISKFANRGCGIHWYIVQQLRSFILWKHWGLWMFKALTQTVRSGPCPPIALGKSASLRHQMCFSLLLNSRYDIKYTTSLAV
jgi:hypothetical protein